MWERKTRQASVSGRSDRGIRSARLVATVVVSYIVAILPSGIAFAADPAFVEATGSPIPVGHSPTQLRTADLNNDGNLDLVSANYFSDDVSVLLGDGMGGFTPAPGSPIPASAGSHPCDLVVADLNDDANADIVTAEFGWGDITVLLGDGQGGFATGPNSFAPDTFGNPCGIVAADFDSDGHPDLALSNVNNKELYVLIGDGSGGFTYLRSVQLGSFPYNLATADLDDDGDYDLVVPSRGSNDVWVLLGDGAGDFGQAPGSPIALTGLHGNAPNQSGEPAVGDLNGDGILDLVVLNPGIDAITVLQGNGDGSFAVLGSPIAVGDTPMSLAIADLNLDGRPDLAVADFYSHTVTLLMGDGLGGFAQLAPPLSVGGQPTAIWAGEVDADHKTDLAVLNYAASVTILLNATVADTGPPTITATPSVGPNVNGWNNTDVTVTYTCTDDGSGVDLDASSLGDDLLAATGTVSGTCVDAEGNTATASYSAQIDKTGPTLHPSMSSDAVLLNASTTVSAGAADGGSGLDVASCDTVDTSTLGPHTVMCTATDKAGNATSASVSYLVYGLPPGGGSFVVGDQSATNDVTFWGAQWRKANSLSGGSAPSAFKGFAKYPAMPTCGSRWSTEPGNSSPPPKGPLPDYMAVIVTSSSSKSGPAISGDTVRVLVVMPDAGYASDPGHAGTGAVVGTIC